MQSWLISAVCLLVVISLPLHAEDASPSLSGTVSLSGTPPSQDEKSEGKVAELIATGIGIDADKAEKQALTAAVQQAVGSYLDTKTITENEEVIKDRVLSLSNGFVSKYDVISGPKQRDDKLFEVTIKAQVQGGQVVAKLKEVNLIKGEVAGQNIYAKNLTQMSRAEDAVKILQEKLPELWENVCQAEFCDEKGIVKKDSNPTKQVQNISENKVKCVWYFRISVNKKAYKELFLPVVERCMKAIGTEHKVFIKQKNPEEYYNRLGIGIELVLADKEGNLVAKKIAYSSPEELGVLSLRPTPLMAKDSFGCLHEIKPAFCTQCMPYGLAEFCNAYLMEVPVDISLDEIKTVAKINIKIISPQIDIRLDEAF